MVGASKILTVSYGTFSCTLEGFDDPFTTMRHIAEYFRDLASEDRYFGCEPPVPDAEMLQQIAQRSISRRVAAETQENGIILRQAAEAEEPAETAAPAAAVTAAALTGAAVAEEPAEDFVAEDVAEEPVAAAAVSEEAPEAVAEPEMEPEAEEIEVAAEAEDEIETVAEDEGEVETAADGDRDADRSVAEKLQRIRLAAGEEPALPEVETAESIAETEEDTSEAEDAEIAVVLAGIGAAAEPPAMFEETAEAEEEAETLDAAAAIWTPEETESAEDTAPETFAEPVAQDAWIEPEDAAVEPVAENPFYALPEAEEAPFEAAEAEMDIAEDEDLVAEETTVEDAEADECAGEASEEALVAEADVAADDTDSDDAEDDLPSIALAEDERRSSRRASGRALNAARRARARLGRFARFDDLQDEEEDEQEAEALNQQDETETAEGIEGDAAFLEATEVVAEFDAPEEEFAALTEELADADPAPAMVTAEVGNEFDPDTTAAEDAIEETDAATAEDADDEMEESHTGALILNSPILPEIAADEPEAEEEIAESSDDVAAEASDDGFGSDLHEAAQAEHPAFARDDAEQEEAALDRLLETTNTKLQGRETTRKRNAFAQLKAAVAATWADRQVQSESPDVTDDPKSEDKTEAYRNDLAEVTGIARKPRDRRPAPLVLVSEQRVDESDGEAGKVAPDAKAEPSGPVRPRRVTTEILTTTESEEDALDSSDNFQEFAERIGAGSLPELLEAAAAYTAHIEGRPRFSRAQVISKIARLKSGEDFSREAGLRSFGKLLREGRIRRVQDGQFVITENSRFVQEARTGTR